MYFLDYLAFVHINYKNILSLKIRHDRRTSLVMNIFLQATKMHIVDTADF